MCCTRCAVSLGVVQSSGGQSCFRSTASIRPTKSGKTCPTWCNMSERTIWLWAPTGAITVVVGVAATRPGSRRCLAICGRGRMCQASWLTRCSWTTPVNSTALQRKEQHMAANHAVVVDHAVSGRLTLREVAPPTPLPSEALVRVAAISLNRGETRRAMEAADGWCPGWDLAGVVAQAAADGSGPRAGARVVGFLRSGAWAESVVVPTNALAELPDAVTFAQAATLPVAGLTALYALTKRGLLLHRRVCITVATGGVGDFAIQLAHLVGAQVIAQVRRPEQVALVKQIGAEDGVMGVQRD